MKTNHEKQVAAWGKLLGICNAHGPKYNPNKDSVKVTAMKALLTSARESLKAADTAENALILAINNRQQVFNILPMLGTRIINALGATDATPELKADANKFRLRFRYPAADRSATQAPGDQGEISSIDSSRGPISHLDFESKMKNLKSLIMLLASELSYQPNEADIQVAALNELQESLTERHLAVTQAELVLKNARIARTNILFSESGIHGRAELVKKYALSAFGSKSPDFKFIKSIRFRK